MSDATEAVAEAFALTRQLLARRLAQKEDLAARVAKLEANRAGIADLTGDEPEAVRREIDAQIAVSRTQLAAAETDVQQARAQLDDLKKLAREAEMNEVRALAGERDPLLRDAEDLALDNVRGHLADMEARLRLEEELAPAREVEPEPTPAAPPPGKPKKTM